MQDLFKRVDDGSPVDVVYEEYKMGDDVLGRTTKEKDLGVTYSADMKASEQCGIAASKGNQIICIIRSSITYK